MGTVQRSRFATCVLHLVVVVSLLLTPAITASAGIAVISPTPEVSSAPATDQQPADPETDTPDAASSAMLTPTLAITATLPPTGAVDAPAGVTPTVTLTLSPPPAPLPYSTPALTLTKIAVPETAVPGDLVTFTLVVSNAGPGPAIDLVLDDTLPPGLRYVRGSAADATFHALQRRLVWQVDELGEEAELVLSFLAQVLAPAGTVLENVATLSGGGLLEPLKASASVEVGEPPPASYALILPRRGGTLTSDDGRVEAVFPPGAVDHPTVARFRLLAPSDLPPDRRLLTHFDLAAWRAGHPEQPLAAFSQPFSLTVTYDDAEVEDVLEEELRLVRYAAGPAPWSPLPAVLDAGARRVTAQLWQPGELGLLAEDDVFFQPRIEAGQVHLFTGDSTFSYELEVPAPAGGLMVPLTLRYHGGIPNNMTGTTNTDTGWVGVGWSLDLGRIEGGDEEGVLTLNGLSTPVIWQELIDEWEEVREDFDTALNGFVGTRQVVRMRMLDEGFLKIISDRFFGTCEPQQQCWPLTQVNGLGHFDIWDQDGTHYVLGGQGYDPASETGSTLAKIDNYGWTRNYRVWKLDKMVDVHGNTLEVVYQVKPTTVHDRTNLKESYPARISYTTNPGAGDTHAEYEVEFLVSAKEFDIRPGKRIAETGYILDGIRVWYQAAPGGARELVRRYSFEYDIIEDSTTGWPESPRARTSRGWRRCRPPSSPTAREASAGRPTTAGPTRPTGPSWSRPTTAMAANWTSTTRSGACRTGTATARAG